MTQTPFKAFNAEVDATPVEDAGEGLIQSADENQQEFLKSVQERNAKLFEYELADAERKDDRWNKLARFSQTAAKIAAPILEAQTQEKYMEGAEKFKNDLAENQELQQAQFELEENIDLHEDIAHTKTVEKARSDNKIDVFLEDKLKQLPRRQETGYLRALYRERAEQYPMFIEQNKNIPVQIQLEDGTFVQRTLEGAKNPNEYRQIERRLYRAYIRPFANHKQPMVKKYLYESMNKTEKEYYDDWFNKRKTVIDNDQQEKDSNEIITSIPQNGHGEAVVAYFNAHSNRHGGNRKTREYVVESILGPEIDGGRFGRKELEQLGDYPVKERATGKMKPFKDVFPDVYGSLETKLSNAGKAIVEQELQDLETVEDNLEAALYEFSREQQEKGLYVHNKHEQEIQKEYTRLTGKTDEPQFLKDFDTVEERNVDYAVDFLHQLRQSKGYLSSSDFKGYPNEVFQKLGHLIEQDKDVASAMTKYEQRRNSRIRGFTNKALKTSIGKTDSGSPDWERGYENALDDYDEMFIGLIGAGVPPSKAHEQSLAKVKEKFLLHDKGAKALRDSEYFEEIEVDDNIKIINDVSNAREVLSGLDTKEAKLNHLSTNVLKDTEEYLASGERYRFGANKDIPWFYKVIARDIPDLDSWDILDAQLKAAGREGLGEKPPLEAALKVTGMEDLRRKLQYRTNEYTQTQAKYDTYDLQNIFQMEDGNGGEDYTSFFNTDESILFPGLSLNN